MVIEGAAIEIPPQQANNQEKGHIIFAGIITQKFVHRQNECKIRNLRKG
jgi:hypothetical protein